MSKSKETKRVDKIMRDIKLLKLGHLNENDFESAVIHTNNALMSLEDVKVLVCEK